MSQNEVCFCGAGDQTQDFGILGNQSTTEL